MGKNYTKAKNGSSPKNATALQVLRKVLWAGDYTARSAARRLLLTNKNHNSAAAATNAKKASDDAERFLDSQFAQAPVYVTPAAAGSITSYPWYNNEDVDDNNDTKLRGVELLDVLVSLFLVGLAVPATLLIRVLGPQARLLQSLLSEAETDDESLTNDRILIRCEADPELVYSLVQIMPVDLSSSSSLLPPPASVLAPTDETPRRTVWIMTDWHPRTLSLTTIIGSGNQPWQDGDPPNLLPTRSSPREDAVMYIGPDSLALVQHWLDGGDASSPDGAGITPGNDGDKSQAATRSPRSMLDLCAGSGIQALVALRLHPSMRTAVCVDVNPRALRFCAANAALNDESHRMELILADLITDRCLRYSRNVPKHDPRLSSVLSTYYPPFDLVTANPPFLPVPPALSIRHGQFSDGGGSGEDVLAAVVRLTAQVLSSRSAGAGTGIAAVVSEFLFDRELSIYCRIRDWWASGVGRTDLKELPPSEAGTVLLLTNECPISVETYAERRSDSISEYGEWYDHLRSLKVTSASPGLLLLRKERDGIISGKRRQGGFTVHHELVPKSPWGSIWTPSNPVAIAFTRNAIRTTFGG
jgi:methylase of polypeptide subunit release factors